MSDINKLVFEQLGYHGVDMLNDKYPASEMNSRQSFSTMHQGDRATQFGGDNRFDKNANFSGPMMGKPNLFFAQSLKQQFAKNDSIGGPKEGQSAIKF